MKEFEPLIPVANRDPIVERNIATWTAIYRKKYQELDFTNLQTYLSEDYCWFGTLGAEYTFSVEDDRQRLLSFAQRTYAGLPDIRFTHHMFGEGNMLGNYLVIEGTHTGNYFGVPATGNRIRFFGVAIARFDEQGRLAEERELWDELQLLRQIRLVKNHDAIFMDGIFKDRNGELIKPKYTPPRPKDPYYFLYDYKRSGYEARKDNVIRNIDQWRKFTDKKYFTPGYVGVDEVMHTDYQYFGSGGAHFNMSDPAQRQAMFLDFTQCKENMLSDIKFYSYLFGEGDMLVYNVSYEYSHNGKEHGVVMAGKKISNANISIGRFDKSGKIVAEFEMHDHLAHFKQLGIIEHNDKNVLLIDVLRNIH